jgi:hypothetical protein
MDQVVHTISQATGIRVEHVYPGGLPKLNVKASKTTRGYTWEITVMGVESVDEALALVKEADAKLQAEFGVAEDE